MEELLWSRRIRAFRKLKGHTQASLANKMGIAVSILGQIERGTRTPDEDFLSQVTEALGISIKELESE
ncbi:XRE family transcriptional regulator [Salibacterium salarium]|uniref:XRE family transcriptional regulator n=1 Tax=Salibacterium salarium TaxID=284579 RepID=A0A428MT53_9BACI|nr:helix-turn-helix transcriptional regulator [Salibacterium salarium]RSL29326.1 XRE family transcriptional regulator [Salibacterium salarium]